MFYFQLLLALWSKSAPSWRAPFSSFLLHFFSTVVCQEYLKCPFCEQQSSSCQIQLCRSLNQLNMTGFFSRSFWSFARCFCFSLVFHQLTRPATSFLASSFHKIWNCRVYLFCTSNLGRTNCPPDLYDEKTALQLLSSHNMQDSCSVAKTGHCFIPQVHPQLHLTPFLLLLYLAVVQCIPVLLQWLWIMGKQRTCTDRYTWTPTPKHTLYCTFPAAWYFPTNLPLHKAEVSSQLEVTPVDWAMGQSGKQMLHAEQ